MIWEEEKEKEEEEEARGREGRITEKGRNGASREVTDKVRR